MRNSRKTNEKNPALSRSTRLSEQTIRASVLYTQLLYEYAICMLHVCHQHGTIGWTDVRTDGSDLRTCIVIVIATERGYKYEIIEFRTKICTRELMWYVHILPPPILLCRMYANYGVCCCVWISVCASCKIFAFRPRFNCHTHAAGIQRLRCMRRRRRGAARLMYYVGIFGYFRNHKIRSVWAKCERKCGSTICVCFCVVCSCTKVVFIVCMFSTVTLRTQHTEIMHSKKNVLR